MPAAFSRLLMAALPDPRELLVERGQYAAGQNAEDEGREDGMAIP
jgi:hypothetical protein